jgi:hypothetical protein
MMSRPMDLDDRRVGEINRRLVQDCKRGSACPNHGDLFFLIEFALHERRCLIATADGVSNEWAEKQARKELGL